MQSVRDYLTRKEIGVRIKDQKTCRVVRMYKGEWIEFGPEYTLPMPSELLEWSPPGIPASTLAVALKIYEMDHLGSDLRAVLLDESRSPGVPLSRRAADRNSNRSRRPKEPKSSVPGKPRTPFQARKQINRPL